MNPKFIFFTTLLVAAALFLTAAHTTQFNNGQDEKRFFADDSFWNQPISANAATDPQSDKWIDILKKEPSGAHFGVNTDKYTIPVYEADEKTPRFTIYHRPPEDKFKQVHGYKNGWFEKNKFYGHGPGFGKNVPIPSGTLMDPAEDAHLVVVDWKAGKVWDMWGVKKEGDKWYSFTGMEYAAKGTGVFNKIPFGMKNGESVHFYGPGRAAGVPVVAGLVMYDEVVAGEIRHKVACATRFNAYQEYCYPAIWTDGCLKGGIPEGAVIQLDPALDLSKFDLTREEIILAKAMQQYGLVVTDQAGGNVIYAQGLYGTPNKSWTDKIRGWKAGIVGIPLSHYRVLKTQPLKKGGLYSESLNKAYFEVEKYVK